MKRHYKSHHKTNRVDYEEYGQPIIDRLDREYKPILSILNHSPTNLAVGRSVGDSGNSERTPFPFPRFCKKWCEHYDCSYDCGRRK